MGKLVMPKGATQTKARKIRKTFQKARPRAGNGRTIKVTHKDLGKKFVEIGLKVRSLSGKPRDRLRKRTTFTLRPGPGYRPGKVRLLLLTPGLKARFGARFRSIQAEQDELVSTSSIRELMEGAQRGGTLSKKELEVLEEAFEAMSKLRFPTRWTGFALKDRVMQHPTARGSGIFGVSSKTMQLHNELDLRRRDAVANAMLDAMREKGATPESIAKAGMRAALVFSLNEFIAPATAKDVRPFARVKNRVQAEEQVKARENLKGILVYLGGKQDAGAADLAREWSSRTGKRTASPARTKGKWSLLAPGPP